MPPRAFLASSQPPLHRQIRVFVSSTFKDMQAEREHLVKHVFPRLRKMCEQRGVTWGEVDLRWGITDEQKAEDSVLTICLAEIHKCRPYFIGILGERYGWIPDRVPAALAESQPWLSNATGASVTELEILHGVLNNSDMAGHAYFYLRSPAFIDALPVAERDAQREGPLPLEVSALGFAEAERRAIQRIRQLQRLKERVRASGFPVRDGFADPKTLGDEVFADFSELIDRLFPLDADGGTDSESVAQAAFMESRRRVYVARRADLETLDRHADGVGPPLAVTGFSGAGKSALLANWISKRDGTRDGELLVSHFIGASPASSAWTTMLARLIGDISGSEGSNREIPDDPASLRERFAETLRSVPANRRLVLVLDALDKLEDRDGAPDLTWLPRDLPSNVRLIISTLPGKSLDETESRAWNTMTVAALDREEKVLLLREFLGQYAKTLDPRLAAAVVDAPQSGSPLYLRQLLDELRQHGEYETLAIKTARCLEAKNAKELFERILERWEADYEAERPGLVRDLVTLVWASKRGLSEVELLELLGKAGEPLQRVLLSTLLLASESSFVDRGGLLGFFHDHLRSAVAERYLPTEAARAEIHSRLASYFAARELGHRKVDELPWQLAGARRWKELSDVLADAAFFEAAWKADASEVKAYWTKIESHSDVRMTDAYAPLLAAHELDDPEHVNHVAFMFRHTGRLDAAEALQRAILVRYNDKSDPRAPSAALNLAAVLAERGDTQGALRLYEQLFERMDEDQPAYGYLLGNFAELLKREGQLDRAIEMRVEEENVFRRFGDMRGLAKSLLGSAEMLKRQDGRIEDARARCAESKQLARMLGDRAIVALSLRFEADLCGDPSAAMKLLAEAETLLREIGDPSGLAITLASRAFLANSQGNTAAALAAIEESETICREHSPVNLAIITHARGQFLQASEQWDAALGKYNEAESLFRAGEDRHRLAMVLEEKAQLLQRTHFAEGELEALKEATQLRRDDHDLAKVAQLLRKQAANLGDRDPVRWLAAVEEEEFLHRASGDRKALKELLYLKMAAFKLQGRREETRALLDEVEMLCRADEDAEMLVVVGLQRNSMAATELCLEAVRLATDRRYEEALPKFRQSLDLAPDYGTCWSDMGICLLDMGRHAEAVPAMTKAAEMLPSDVLNWSKLGVAHLYLGNTPKATECLQRCQALAPRDQWTLMLSRMLDIVREELAKEKPSDVMTSHNTDGKSPWWKFWG